MQVYAVPPDCQVSPRTQATGGVNAQNRLSLPRTNPRASRNSTLLRPSVVNVPDDWDRLFLEVILKSKLMIFRTSDYWRDRGENNYRSQLESQVESQAREIERLMRENIELKSKMMSSTKTVDSKVNFRKSNFDFFNQK